MKPLALAARASGLIVGTWAYQALKTAPRWESAADASFGILLFAVLLIWEFRSK